MTHDNPYDAAEDAWRDEDLRQALADQADEEYNERRMLGEVEASFGVIAKRMLSDDVETLYKLEAIPHHYESPTMNRKLAAAKQWLAEHSR